MEELVLGALQWDPQIRGLLIVLTSIVLLPGSVYLLLATNTGARVGFMLAIAGLAGWMLLMGVTWIVYGIGLKGRAAEWKVTDVIPAGDARQATLGAMESFPESWTAMPPGDPDLGEAQAAADKVLAEASADEGGHGAEGGGEAHAPKFAPLFGATTDYVQVAGYRTGGENHFFGLLEWDYAEKATGPDAILRKLAFLHRPHYAVIQVQPAREQAQIEGLPPNQPRRDLTQPVATVVMVRDLGNLRVPPFLVTLSSGIVFAVVCNALHRRDKEIARLRAAPAAA